MITHIKKITNTSYRLNEVEVFLFGEDKEACAILPFKGAFPIIKPLYNTGFVNSTRASWKYDDLPDSIKHVVERAEKFKYYENLFLLFLKTKSINREVFKKLTPEAKKTEIEEWMLHDRIPDGILK